MNNDSINPTTIDNISINAIVRCAFKICFLYILKCFVPSISIRSYIKLCETSNYDDELNDQILIMKKLLNSCLCEYEKNNDKYDKYDKYGKYCKHDKKNICITKTNDHDIALKNAAYDEIKMNIVDQLKEKYGDNIAIDFTYDNSKKNKDNKEKVLYALKIKEIGKNTPKIKKFNESEIYVNTETNMFHIRTKDGFHIFPLIKKSLVKVEHQQN